MQIEIDYPTTPTIGFGAVIGLLSFLVSTGDCYKIYLGREGAYSKSIVELAKIFGISQDTIEFVPIGEQRVLSRDFVDNLLDNAKVFCKYISPDTLTLYDKQFPTNRNKRKKYVCLAIAGNSKAARNIYFNDTAQALANNNFPVKFRDYTRKEIDKILELIVDSGYELVTLESPAVTVEQKVFVLNELCDCIIGYEGGMMHLAHCLGVPSIIFPWQDVHNVMHNWGIDNVAATRSMLMHIDKRTYFIESPEELHSWDAPKFQQIIDDLFDKKGNNVLLNKDTVEKINQLDIDKRFDILAVPTLLRDTIKNMNNLSIGGY